MSCGCNDTANNIGNCGNGLDCGCEDVIDSRDVKCPEGEPCPEAIDINCAPYTIICDGAAESTTVKAALDILFAKFCGEGFYQLVKKILETARDNPALSEILCDATCACDCTGNRSDQTPNNVSVTPN